MSLPAKARFYLNGEEISEQYINVGWFVTESGLTHVMLELDYPVEWDELRMYEYIYTPMDVVKRVKKLMDKDPDYVDRILNEKREFEIEMSLSVEDEDLFI